jgi:hypothetical protein
VFRGLQKASRYWLPLITLILPIFSLSGQVIEFSSNGLRYRAVTRHGLTLMYAPMPLTVRDYAVLQIAFNNGSSESWIVQPTDFSYHLPDGRILPAASEQHVVSELYRHAGENEVVKLQSAYEKAIYGNQHIRSNNGYEQRRQAAMAFGSKGIKAAAAASAISFAKTKLDPSDSTDGAVFFPNQGRELGPGKLFVRLQDGAFEIELE